MTLGQPYEQSWRGKADFVVSKLDRAHAAVHVLGAALESGNTRTVRRHYRSVRNEVASVAREVKTLRTEQPSTASMPESTVAGSTLAIRGSDAAAIALDVMVDAMAVLTTTEVGAETDVLIGACIDAERVYEDSTAVVKAASHAHGSAIVDLEHAFDTEGEVFLRRRVEETRTRLHKAAERMIGPA